MNPIPNCIIETVDTPAYVIDASQLVANASAIRQLAGPQATLLFALKAFTLIPPLRTLAAHVDGFAASSLCEARLARDLASSSGRVHFTAPAVPARDFAELTRISDCIACNSPAQWERFASLDGTASLGLRVNPGLSLTDDERYDPCRTASKLGTPLAEARQWLDTRDDSAPPVEGIHFHSNSEGDDLAGLDQTVARVEEALGAHLHKLQWLNLGGGYWYPDADNRTKLRPLVERLAETYGLHVVLEPGMSVASDAGFLVTQVEDVFQRDGRTIAVLDTAVNHLPEVLEFEWEPELLPTIPEGPVRCVLAGCTCLAGDLFGEHGFARPLVPGDRLAFTYAGAYSQVKADWFNGVCPPTIYLTEAETWNLTEFRRFGYEDFLRQYSS